MIRMRESARASLLRRGPAQAGRRGRETTAPVASSLAASPLNAAKSHPRSWRGHRASDIFVLATVLAERSFIVGADSSSKCHNFLSMSPGAESLPLMITTLLHCHHKKVWLRRFSASGRRGRLLRARSPGGGRPAAGGRRG
jgi:hypothetical protein